MNKRKAGAYEYYESNDIGSARVCGGVCMPYSVFVQPNGANIEYMTDARYKEILYAWCKLGADNNWYDWFLQNNQVVKRMIKAYAKMQNTATNEFNKLRSSHAHECNMLRSSHAMELEDLHTELTTMRHKFERDMHTMKEKSGSAVLDARSEMEEQARQAHHAISQWAEQADVLRSAVQQLQSQVDAQRSARHPHETTNTDCIPELELRAAERTKRRRRLLDKIASRL